MFRKKPEQPAQAEPEAKPALPMKERKPGAFKPELARPDRSDGRGSDVSPEAKTLVIGREINLKGEIRDCDSLMVHGTADAELTNCRRFHITESGTLTGTAEVHDAEVQGRFEGTLKVRGRLIIRSGGRVHGAVSYAEIEIEPGGRIDGEIDTIEPELVQNRATG